MSSDVSYSPIESLCLYPNPGRFIAIKRHFRWAVKADLRQALALRWFAFLEQSGMKPFLDAHPRLVFRPMGRYMSLRWNWKQRIKVIQETYQFILSRSARRARSACSSNWSTSLALSRTSGARRVCGRMSGLWISLQQIQSGCAPGAGLAQSQIGRPIVRR